ncbi:MAG: SWIM/SEC-C metal-binding protein [Halieaceae bacterium]|jgi:SWIM/SEC-C metal-binding protein
MSDKFFFQGGSAPRSDHSGSAYTTKAASRGGSKKYPLQLTVGSEQRKTEVEALVAEHGLFADITINADPEAEENTAELMALVNRAPTLTVAKTPNRNEPCICGSGKKYKKCCG